MNPITFRGTTNSGGVGEKVALTVGRLWIKKKVGEDWQKPVVLVLYKEPEFGVFTPENLLGQVVLDEDHLINGLRTLFPRGELCVNDEPGNGTPPVGD